MSSRNPSRMNGFVYLVSFIPSIIILVTGIVLMNAKYTDYMSLFHWLFIIIGVCTVIVSPMGFAGSRYNKDWFLNIYFLAMPFIIFVLFIVILIPFIFTHEGSGRSVSNRVYQDYYLEDYSGWLKNKVVSDTNWGKMRSLIHDSEVCSKTSQLIGEYQETEYIYCRRKLNPIQPPTECGYTYVNETVWSQVNQTIFNPVNATTLPGNLDCIRWSNNQQSLCYGCDSCKAGVLASLKHRWRMVLIMNVGALATLIIICIVACFCDKSSTNADTRNTRYPNRSTHVNSMNTHSSNRNNDGVILNMFDAISNGFGTKLRRYVG